MTILRVPYDSHYYVVNSAELVSGSVISGSLVTEGGKVYISDLQQWKVINSDMSLTDYVINTDGTGGSTGSYVATSGSSKYSSYSASSVYATHIKQEAIFAMDGNLYVNANPLRLYNVTGVDRTISNVFCAVATPCSGSTAIIVDVKNSGSSIFSSKPQINTGSYTGSSSSISMSTWSNNQFLTMSVDQVGNTATGSALTVHVIFV